MGRERAGSKFGRRFDQQALHFSAFDYSWEHLVESQERSFWYLRAAPQAARAKKK